MPPRRILSTPIPKKTNFSLTVHRYIRGGWIGKDGTLATLGKIRRVGKVGNLDKIVRIGNLARTAGFEPANRGFANHRLRPLGYVALIYIRNNAEEET